MALMAGVSVVRGLVTQRHVHQARDRLELFFNPLQPLREQREGSVGVEHFLVQLLNEIVLRHQAKLELGDTVLVGHELR